MSSRPRALPFLLLWLLPLAAIAQPDTDADTDAVADSIVGSDRRLFDTLPPAGMRPAHDRDLPDHWMEMLPAIRGRQGSLLGLDEMPPTLIGYSRADGPFIGLGGDLPARILPDAATYGYLGGGYGFGSHYWQVYGGIEHDLLSRSTPLRIGAEGHVLTDTRDAWKMGRNENTLLALLAGIDARDYFQRRGFSLSARQFITPRLWLQGELRLDEYRNARREAGWSLFGPRQPFTEIRPIREGAMRSLIGSLCFDGITLRGWDDPQLGAEGRVEFGRTREHGSGDGAFIHYTIDARIRGEVIEGLLWIAARGRIGGATGDVPPQRLFTIGGLGTLPGYPQNAYEGNRMVLLQTELLVAPAGSVRPLRDLRMILSNDIGAVATAATDASLLSMIPGTARAYHYAPGIFLGSATGAFRIGCAFRTDRSADPELVVRLTRPY